MKTNHTAARLAGAALLLSALLGATASRAQQPGATAPDPVEMAFWQSTERIGTADAYRAYLARYPKGTFAPLATAAMGKVDPATPHLAPATPSATPPSSAMVGTLRPFSMVPEGGAVSFNLGDELVGPIALPVGALGARKQVALPKGPWVVLAANHRHVTHAHFLSTVGPVRVRITDTAFGKFSGNRMTSLLVASFTDEKAPPLSAGLLPCDTTATVQTVPIRSDDPAPSGWRDEAATLSATSAALQGVVADDIRASLAKLGSQMPTQIALTSCFAFSDRQRGALRIHRYVWPTAATLEGATAPGAWGALAVDASPARKQVVDKVWSWARGYRGVARDGYLNDLDSVQLADIDDAVSAVR